MPEENNRKLIDKLESALKSFSTARYSEILEIMNMNGRFICPHEPSPAGVKYFLRHDVDYAPECAVNLARIEYKNDVHSHYYFLTNSIAYNVYHYEFANYLREILELGHCIGLHYESRIHGMTANEEIHQQANVLRQISKVEIRDFSPHNPGSLTAAQSIDTSGEYLNVYNFLNEMGYLSDSNCKWDAGFLSHFINNLDSDYQILIHPEWWGDQDATPLTKILSHQTKKIVDELCVYQEYLLNQKKYGVSDTAMYVLKSEAITESIRKILGNGNG